MRVLFIWLDNGPERQVCDADPTFSDGPLAGMKLVGFFLWNGADGETYVTFPSRELIETVGISFRSPDGDAAVGGFGRHRRGLRPRNGFIFNRYKTAFSPSR